MSDNGFRFGDWQIDPDSNTLRTEGASATVEPKAMDVLRYLCRHAGAVIPPEELLQACWGNAELGDNPIHKAITQLRRALGDSASEPRYIETVRKRGYRAIAPVIATEVALEGSWKQGSPFRGLESFQESHASIFFGRMQATAQLRELVLQQTSDGCAMALVLGPSGSGKTSLVRAGLLPGLMASRTGSGEPVALACTLYMDCADLANGNLFQAVAAVLIDAEVGGQLVFSGENAEGLGRWLESSDAETIAGRFREVAGKIKIGLFVDRLEAIFRAPGVTDEIRARFIAVLEHLARSRAVLVMLACRNDFYPEVIALPALMALKSRGGHFDLNPPDGAEIAQMVRMPAKAAGLKFEVDQATGASLDDVLCDEARSSPDTLPLLQYCLNELYSQRGQSGHLTFEVFKQLGGIEGAIAVRAEQVVTGLSSMQLAALPHVLSLIVDLTEEQGAVTARRTAWVSLPNVAAQELVHALVEARLFVSELSGEVPCFGMAHEALLRRWPRVMDWIDQHRHALQVRTRISQEAERWDHAGRPKDLLLPQGIRISQVKALVDSDAFVLHGLELEFIQKSLHRAKLAERIKVAIVSAIVGLAILAGILGLTAYKAQLTAEHHRSEAEGLMSYMLVDFVDILRPIGKLQLLDGISKKAMGYLSTVSSDNASPAALAQRAKSLQIIAEINIARGNPDIAMNALQIARTILWDQDKAISRNKTLLKDLGANSFYIGQIHLNKNNLAEAEQYLQEYNRFSSRMIEAFPSDQEAKTEKFYALSSLGSVLLKRAEMNKAIHLFEQAAKINRELLQEKPGDRQLSNDLANVLAGLASAKARLGLLEDAAVLYREEVELLRRQKEKTSDDAQTNYRLANSHWHYAEMKYIQGKLKDSIQDLAQAKALLLELVKRDSTNKTWQIVLLSVQARMADLEEQTIAPTVMLENLRNLQVKLETLENSNKNHRQLRLMRLRTMYRQSAILAKAGRLAEADAMISPVLIEFSNIQQNDPKDTSFSAHYSEALLVKAEVLKAKNDFQGMTASCREAQAILDPALKKHKDYWLLSPNVRAFYCTGDHERVSEQVAELKKIGFREPNYVNTLSAHP